MEIVCRKKFAVVVLAAVLLLTGCGSQVGQASSGGMVAETGSAAAKTESTAAETEPAAETESAAAETGSAAAKTDSAIADSDAGDVVDQSDDGAQEAAAAAASTTSAAESAVTEGTEETTNTTEATDATQSVDAAPVRNEDGSVSLDVFAMDTYMTLKAWGDEEAATKAVKDGAAEIHRLDALLSTGDSSSEIAKVNENGGGIVSQDTGYLIRRALSLYQDTDGAFDIAIYPVVQLWGFPTQEYRVPSENEIEAALKLSDASQLTLTAMENGEQYEVSFAQQGMEIDLGGIAKGYTSARLMDIFQADGVTSGLVSLGGNVQTLGTKTDGSLWRVAIEDPDSDYDYLGVLQCHDKAVITSGAYERYFEEDGKIYHHIIDPSTGYPAESGIESSTIVSDDGTLADGLSTSLFIMGLEKAEAYWRQHSDEFDFILETEDGVLHVTEGIADDLTTQRKVEIVGMQ